jgi:hypothetical protein
LTSQELADILRAARVQARATTISGMMWSRIIAGDFGPDYRPDVHWPQFEADMAGAISLLEAGPDGPLFPSEALFPHG